MPRNPSFSESLWPATTPTNVCVCFSGGCTHLRTEFHRFLTALSVRPGRYLTTCAHLLRTTIPEGGVQTLGEWGAGRRQREWCARSVCLRVCVCERARMCVRIRLKGGSEGLNAGFYLPIHTLPYSLRVWEERGHRKSLRGGRATRHEGLGPHPILAAPSNG
jgi:hypothetical protein